MWGAILRTTELSKAYAFSFLVPAFGLAMGAVFFDKQIGWLELAGIGLILVGIVLANHDRDTQRAKEHVSVVARSDRVPVTPLAPDGNQD